MKNPMSNKEKIWDQNRALKQGFSQKPMQLSRIG